MGQATAAIATARPDVDFIGIEVHEPGVGALLKHIDEARISNVRIVQHDAVPVLEQMIAPASLAGVNVFFPDPWHKKKHHKRRLVQPAFVALLASRLAPGGALHCATDWQPYAEQMLAVLAAEPMLGNTCDRLRAAAGRPAVDQVRTARPGPRARCVGPRLHATVRPAAALSRALRYGSSSAMKSCSPSASATQAETPADDHRRST